MGRHRRCYRRIAGRAGNEGILITDASFEDFEIVMEMNNDFGPDSGLFLRSTEDGKAWQAMIDYHADGNVMGIYGEGLGGKPHVRNYSFKKTVEDITTKHTGKPPITLAILPESWPHFWRHGQWNECRARIVGNRTSPHGSTESRSWNGRKKRNGMSTKGASLFRCMEVVIIQASM